MIYAVLSLGLALLGEIIYLAQTLRLSVPLLYGGIGYHGIPPVVSGPYRSGGRHFPCAGGLAALSWVVTLIRAVRETIW